MSVPARLLNPQEDRWWIPSALLVASVHVKKQIESRGWEQELLEYFEITTFELHQWVNVFFCFKTVESRPPLYRLRAIVPIDAFLERLLVDSLILRSINVRNSGKSIVPLLSTSTSLARFDWTGVSHMVRIYSSLDHSLEISLGWVFVKGAHDCTKLLSAQVSDQVREWVVIERYLRSNGSIAIFIKDGKGFLELCDLFNAKLVGHDALEQIVETSRKVHSDSDARTLLYSQRT